MRLSRASFFVVMLLLGIHATATAQTAPSPQMKAASELLNSQKWEEAAKAYEAITASEPANARAWYLLGISRFSLKQFEAAIAAFQKNIAITNNPTAMYNVACAFARLNQKAQAMEWLEKAVNNKLSPFTNIATDEDLASLRNEPKFNELALVLDKQRRPCIYSNSAREFDFWVGEWDVFNPQGQKAGTSVIQQIADGCGVLENWTGTIGGTGKSINFYDPSSSKWYQYWIGANGQPARLQGTYREGAMRYEGERPGQPRTLTRLTFFNVDGNTVRQLGENSNDEGKTWTTTFDFKYVRKKSSSGD
jgi:tetratricopeptide (TPR) repeat protein